MQGGSGGTQSLQSDQLSHVGIGSARYLFQFGRFCIKTLYETHLDEALSKKMDDMAESMDSIGASLQISLGIAGLCLSQDLGKQGFGTFP